MKKRLWLLALLCLLVLLCLVFLFVNGRTGVSGDRGSEELRDFVLSQGQVETSAGNAVTLQLVLTQGTRTVYQGEDGEEKERYEGVYELQTLDVQGQLLDRVELLNEQGGEGMRFCYRDFPWYFEDYNLDGQQDFFLGTESADWGSYRYLFTVTAEGGLRYLYDGPMGGSPVMDADSVTNAYLETGDGSADHRVFFLYQMDPEYSSHDFYTWNPELGTYRKRVDFTGVYPEGWSQDAADYLEGEWRITENALWERETEGPKYRVGETLRYTDGVFRRTDAAGATVYESDMRGCSVLEQSAEEFRDTHDVAADWPDAHTERVLIDLGEECDLGNVVYKLDDHTILVYELGSDGTFWMAVRTETRE